MIMVVELYRLIALNSLITCGPFRCGALDYESSAKQGHGYSASFTTSEPIVQSKSCDLIISGHHHEKSNASTLWSVCLLGHSRAQVICEQKSNLPRSIHFKGCPKHQINQIWNPSIVAFSSFSRPQRTFTASNCHIITMPVLSKDEKKREAHIKGVRAAKAAQHGGNLKIPVCKRCYEQHRRCPGPEVDHKGDWDFSRKCLRCAKSCNVVCDFHGPKCRM
jgi:hypothetical protein